MRRVTEVILGQIGLGLVIAMSVLGTTGLVEFFFDVENTYGLYLITGLIYGMASLKILLWLGWWD